MKETTIPTNELPGILAQPTAPFRIGGLEAVALPPGWSLEAREFDEDTLDAPKRIRRNVVAHEVGGFISYVNRFRSTLTALYCAADTNPSLTARLDDHQPGTPSHVEHTATFGCPVSEEWGRWMKANKTRMGQRDFAEFIEDNLRDIAEPSGAGFLSAVTNFADARQVEFKSAQRLSDGMVQFSYVEKEDAQQVQFPTRIKIAVPVFMGMPDRYAVEARIKYALKDGALSLWYELDRPDLTKKLAYNELLDHVEQQTGLHIHRAI